LRESPLCGCRSGTPVKIGEYDDFALGMSDGLRHGIPSAQMRGRGFKTKTAATKY
jgi:hypothetical protein